MKKKHFLIFGGSGSIGSSIIEKFESNDWIVTCISRNKENSKNTIFWDVLNDSNPQIVDQILNFGLVDAVCWAQGMNGNDNIRNFDEKFHMELYKVNVVFILKSLNFLLNKNLLNQNAKLCILSSIWQLISRQEKLSYGITKSAIQGLVLSLANDLAKDGYFVNAVLPGVIDTPMTHQNLSQLQIDKVKQSTGFNKLNNLEDVANAVHFLLSSNNSGITGQFIKVDLGFSDVRII